MQHLLMNPNYTKIIYMINIRDLLRDHPLSDMRMKFYREAFADFLRNTIFVVSGWSYSIDRMIERKQMQVNETHIEYMIRRFLSRNGLNFPQPKIYFIDSYYDPTDSMQLNKFEKNMNEFWSYV